MDIDLLAKMVKKLILDSDRVVLPGLGCFVAEVVPATFSDRGYTINPPYRKLYFRSKPDEGDELVDFYAQTNNLPFDVAEGVVRDFLTEMKSVLFMKKIVVFPGLGRLRATKENDIFFVADEGLDIYPSGFGLEPISLKSHQETREEVSAAVSDLKSILVEPTPVQTPVLEPVPEPVQEPKPEPVSEPKPESKPMPEPESEPEPIAEQVEDEPEASVPGKGVWLSEAVQKVKDFGCRTWRWLMAPERRVPVLVVGGVIAATLLFFVLYVALANIFPSWMDALLYSNEELEILNQIYE